MNDIQNTLLKKRFINEIEFIKTAIQTGIPISHFENAKTINLQQRLRILELIISKLTLGGSKLNLIETPMTMNQYFNKVDNNIYKKMWQKLQPFHKCVKIKEYIDDTYGTGKFQTEIIDKLSNLIHNGELVKKHHIVYDPNDEKILSIPILTVSIKENKYDIKIN